MKNFERRLAECAKRRARERWRRRLMVCLATIIVFCTTCATISPVASMENMCTIPEHTHSEACYDQITVTRRAPVCTAERLGIHRHTDACQDSDGAYVCGYADFVVHIHDEFCYEQDGNLWCPLPAIRPHVHGTGCYAQAEVPGAHQHTDDCYAWEPGALICGEEERDGHAHDETQCYAITSTLVCQIPEGAGHRHELSCLDEGGSVICGLAEGEGAHSHGEECFEEARALTCAIPEDAGHHHSDACYEKVQGALTCAESAEPKLVCTREEIILHAHDASCCNEDGWLICGKRQVLEHEHSDACFEVSVETKRTDDLICGKKEHVHTEECCISESEVKPTAEPTAEPTKEPTTEPTVEPTEKPTVEPTAEPTIEPTEEPTAEPTVEPTVEPTAEPTEMIQEEQKHPALIIPADWPVRGNVYVSAGPMRRAAARAGAQESAPELVARTAPLDLEGYIENATLFYRTNSGGKWQPVTENTVLPGTADLQLNVIYDKVNITRLLEAGCTLTCTLPEIMRDPHVNGKLTSGGTDVGIITASGRTVTLTFDRTWLEQQNTQENSVINGDFSVEAEIDLSNVQESGKAELTMGKVTIGVNFEEDIIAKSAKLDIEKSAPRFSQEGDGDYLTYTLTVTAGEDGAPAVRVVDAFADQNRIDAYVGVSATEAPTSGNISPDAGPVETMPEGSNAGAVKLENGSMVWTIGNMGANETRTLTYKVRLKENYTQNGSTEIVTNAATPYSKDFPRDPAVSNFTPEIQTSITKQSVDFVPNENGDGGGTITYTIWVHADEHNTYTLKNVKIEDTLDRTDEKYRPYLSYDETSFRLFKGGSKDQNGSAGLEPIDGTNPPTFAESKRSFSYNAGSLGPGESKTLTYTVQVAPGTFVAAGNSDIHVKNHAAICMGDPENTLNSCDGDRTVSKKMWSRKLAGERQASNTPIEMAGNAYDATGGSVTPMANPGEFIVPAGSYQYQIVANEAGDWDISSASMTDELSGAYMQFVGYVRVDAYTIDGNAPASELTDQQAIANLKGRTPAQTAWVKVDGGTSFNFAPKQIGLDGKCAYLFTYYAQPVNLAGVTQVIVGNTFTMEGILGDVRLTGIQVDAFVTVEGTNSFTAQKMSWYHEEKPTENPGNYANGAMYWVVKVDGNVIPAGTILRDETEGGASHYLYKDSVVGVYTGSAGDQFARDYVDLAALLDSGKLKTVDGECYSVSRVDSKNLTIQLLQEIKLENGESLYAIIKTEPYSVPAGIRDTMTFKNTLKSSYDGTHWVTYPEAQQVLCGSSGVFKEPNRVITWDGEEYEEQYTNDGHTHNDLLYDLMEPGTYVIWHIQANYLGNLSGRYRFEEIIPEGMELAYVAHYWYGPNYGSSTPRSVAAELGSAWERHETWKKGVNCIYYTSGNRVIWEVDGLVDGGVLDGYGAEYQIACRVTDPQVMFGNVSKSFENQVILYKGPDKEVGRSSHTIEVEKSTITKTGNYDAKTNGGRYPFIITLNPLGEDM